MDTLKFDQQGLLPAVILDDATGDVLMVAFMSKESLQLTRETGYTHFFSRSRQKIWRKGEESGNVQEVRDIFVNCEVNSLLIRVHQHGDAACHDGYYSCYYRCLLPDNTLETVAERVFDPATVYSKAPHSATIPVATDEGEFRVATEKAAPEMVQKLDEEMRLLYGVYLYLRDHDLSEESNTSRLLQERSQNYLVSRLADELQELAEVQSGMHVHSGRQFDTVLEGSQVGYWLFLLAAGSNVSYNDFTPHAALLTGYSEAFSDGKALELREECLKLCSETDPSLIAQGLQRGFALVGWACAEAQVNPLEPAEYDLDQMRRKGLVQ